MKNDSYPTPGEEWKIARAAQPYHLTSLCSSCMHTKKCVFPKDRQAPVFFCEEYEIEPGPLPQEVKAKPSDPPALKDSRDKDSDSIIGLCSNCAHRKTCSYPKPEGGIWHCEEYQ
jgi:hypothetical protein